jgi:predicted DNA-binding protein with PD1-like motif
LGRLPKGGDLLAALCARCAEQGVRRGGVQVIGALERARLAYYRQREQRYVERTFDRHLEILAGLGNVSLKDGEPFVHLHLTLGDEDFGCLGGHALPGCVVFAAEALILPLEGPALVRAPDKPTGLPLWQC